MTTTFLSLAEVLEIHQDQIERYGGGPGIRDINLLKSALAMPMTSFSGEFLHTDIFEMAAAYLFHLVRNHPFIDGNKRVAAVTAIVFLMLNGYEYRASPKDLVDMVLSAAQGHITKSEIAGLLKQWSKRA